MRWRLASARIAEESEADLEVKALLRLQLSKARREELVVVADIKTESTSAPSTSAGRKRQLTPKPA
jgi:hypothetical protein